MTEICVIDDDRDMQRALRDHLELDGFKVREASNAYEAVRLHEGLKLLFATFLLDVIFRGYQDIKRQIKFSVSALKVSPFLAAGWGPRALDDLGGVMTDSDPIKVHNAVLAAADIARVYSHPDTHAKIHELFGDALLSHVSTTIPREGGTSEDLLSPAAILFCRTNFERGVVAIRDRILTGRDSSKTRVALVKVLGTELPPSGSVPLLISLDRSLRDNPNSNVRKAVKRLLDELSDGQTQDEEMAAAA